MTNVLDPLGSPDAATPRRSRPRRIGAGILVVVLLAGAISGFEWWRHSGTFLDASGAGYGGPASPNELYSVGIQLETRSGGSVTLDRATAAPIAGAQVTWSIFQSGPGGTGFGAARGPLLPDWPTVPVHGLRVAQPSGHPDDGATWLVASVRAARPGVYHLTDIRVKYHSGRRTRSVSSPTTLCVLVHAPADGPRILKQMDAFEAYATDLSTVDPLVAEYERCSGQAEFP